MMKTLSTTLALATLLVSGSALSVERAEDCVLLEQRAPVELELETGNGYANCFRITDIEEEVELHITAMSETDYKHQVKVYELNPGSRVEALGTYESNDKSVTQVAVPKTDKDLAFSIVPTSSQSTNKSLKVHYLHMGESPQVIVEMYEIF
ncbi:hypothetical protein CWE09_00790 [Aliidiomarina minuta]|uniref:Uncharacterized protein n=1 Tax=Aliidiomarina minuta TaxID=880057 RepID=A0A432W5F8_9GAMM|nr:hypothetical protein [Aliidiomarina minuta]RUO25305.1 hypothetical protein CWE09_00790 [Aliidiomarina minuta]